MRCRLNHLVSSDTRQPKNPGNAAYTVWEAARLGYKIRVQSERVKTKCVKTSHWFVYILHWMWSGSRWGKTRPKKPSLILLRLSFLPSLFFMFPSFPSSSPTVIQPILPGAHDCEADLIGKIRRPCKALKRKKETHRTNEWQCEADGGGVLSELNQIFL